MNEENITELIKKIDKTDDNKKSINEISELITTQIPQEKQYLGLTVNTKVKKYIEIKVPGIVRTANPSKGKSIKSLNPQKDNQIIKH